MNANKIIIKAIKKSPRLDYCLDFIFNHFFDCGYSYALDSNKPFHINYSDEESIGSICIRPSGYLFDGSLPQMSFLLEDVFSYIFYRLSCAEDYARNSSDNFGRFNGGDSKFRDELQVPGVDIALLNLAKQLVDLFGIHLERKESFRLIHTVDVDQFYAYQQKDIIRKIGGLSSSLLKAEGSRIKDRINVAFGAKDPYDTFDLLIHSARGIESHFFILVGNYDKVDNALKIENEAIQKKIKAINLESSIGIHPSIASGRNFDLLKKEKQRLEAVVGSTITSSRQHFLQLHFPNTYRSLIELGILNDFSLGYHDLIGFRAGTTNSFYWFDLERNEKTKLMIHPLSVMDVSLKKYMDLAPQQALVEVKNLIDVCRKVNGPFSLLWHNSSFYDEEGWAGWRDTYLEIIKYCRT